MEMYKRVITLKPMPLTVKVFVILFVAVPTLCNMFPSSIRSVETITKFHHNFKTYFHNIAYIGVSSNLLCVCVCVRVRACVRACVCVIYIYI